MREIKFRGKRVDNGEWVVGYYGTNESGWHWIFVPICENSVNSFKFVRVIPETVGQFTGLHDKNGKEIYEKDILGSINFKDFIGVMEWMPNGSWAVFSPLSNFEIIGNLFDNPELITQ
jgi:uncharacterized phage protein (TIGR01671 family)